MATEPETTTKHTPGPWRVDDDNAKNVRAGGVGGLFVAKTYAIPVEDNPDDAYNREQIANARLIAAAPDLLEAARVAESFLRHRTAESLGEAGVLARRVIRAALAKAEPGA